MGVLVIYTIKISGEDLNVIGEGLDELKMKIAAPVAGRIRVQLNEQNIAAEALAKAAAAPATKSKRTK